MYMEDKCAKKEDRITPDSVYKNLQPELSFLQLEIHESIDSTNTRAKECALQGKEEGLVILAQEQTAGRGRMGRSFYSPSGSGLYVSFLLRPQFAPQEALFLTTAAAVAVAEAIEEVTGVQADIKWVNDVFCHGKKVCGILTESSVNSEQKQLEYAVTGIGLNLWEPENGFSEELQTIAGTIYQGAMPDLEKANMIRCRLIASLIQHFWYYYEHLTDKRFMPEYKRRSFLLGKEVYTVSENSVVGLAVDVDDDGHLVLECKDGSRVVLDSGEVSVRPVS